MQNYKKCFLSALLALSLLLVGGPAVAAADGGFVIEQGKLTEYHGTDTHVVVPDGVTEIGGAFTGNETIVSVELPETVNVIDSNAFYHCTSLQTVNIPDGVETIEDWTFAGCTSLLSVTLPDSVTQIGIQPFYQCSSLREVHLSSGLTYMGEGAFEDCTSLRTVVLPETLDSVDELAFWGCTDLQSILILNPDLMYISLADYTRTALYGYPGGIAESTARMSDLITYRYISRDTVLWPGKSQVTLDGEPVTWRSFVYVGPGGGAVNYIMLRDVANLLNGTDAQFSVDWAPDTGISITTGQPYTPVGSEGRGPALDPAVYTKRDVTMQIDGRDVTLSAVVIDGNHYFAIRDLGAALGFGVSWENQTVILES